MTAPARTSPAATAATRGHTVDDVAGTAENWATAPKLSCVWVRSLASRVSAQPKAAYWLADATPGGWRRSELKLTPRLKLTGWSLISMLCDQVLPPSVEYE